MSVLGHPELHSKFKNSLSYRRPSLSKSETRNKILSKDVPYYLRQGLTLWSKVALKWWGYACLVLSVLCNSFINLSTSERGKCFALSSRFDWSTDWIPRITRAKQTIPVSTKQNKTQQQQPGLYGEYQSYTVRFSPPALNTLPSPSLSVSLLFWIPAQIMKAVSNSHLKRKPNASVYRVFIWIWEKSIWIYSYVFYFSS